MSELRVDLDQLPQQRYETRAPDLINSETTETPDYILGNHELPIATHREAIEEAIWENAVTIVVAPTGSGKTTQVPQYAREMMRDDEDRAEFDEIIVTQPRIVAARSVSERVASEIAAAGEADKVGYYTSNEGTPSPQRQQDIAFLTDGKAMAQLLHGRDHNSDKKRLLIIDEVHEWNLNIEMLIAIATARTNPASPQYDPNLKVVIMSATMDSKGLQKHFGQLKPPIIEVDVPTHEVTHSVSRRSVADMALELAAENRQIVLGFYPGKREINKAAEEIAKKQAGVRATDRVPVIPLHGQQTAADQRRAFEEYPAGAVIATTNAAETSLTVPGAKAVVDSGLVRIDRLRYDRVSTGSAGLYLEPAPRANLKQRAGRVGRTAPGQYVLCSPDGKQVPVPVEARPEYETPAIQRTRLDGLLLHLIATGHDTSDFPFFHKPPVEAVAAAKKRLFTLGAVDKTGTITERGLFMEKLPLDPEYSAMVAFAYENDYSEKVKANVLDIAAIMQLGGILKRAPKELGWRELLQKDEYDEVKEQDSDFFAQLEAYVALTTIKTKDWEKYDIIEHSAGLVEQGRASLADKLGVTLHQPVVIDQGSRQAVLTCINAGQLSQLWRRNGETWSLLLEPSEEYELAESSVVNELGKLATGSLFTLGLAGGRTIESVQNVNITTPKNLEAAAAHLTVDVILPNSIVFSQEQQGLIARVDRKLGNLVLRSFMSPVEVAPDSPEMDKMRQGYRDYAWNVMSEKKPPRILYNLDSIGDALADPTSMQYGTDPVTNEPLLAWMGGSGQWCRTREVAIHSLAACQARLIKAQREPEIRATKEAVQATSAKLIALKNTPSRDAAKALLSKKKKMDRHKWLAQAQEFLEETQLSDTA